MFPRLLSFFPGARATAECNFFRSLPPPISAKKCFTFIEIQTVIRCIPLKLNELFAEYRKQMSCECVADGRRFS